MSKIKFLIALFTFNIPLSYALNCEQIYQGHDFKRVAISVEMGDVRCNYYNGNGELTYYIGDGVKDWYKPTTGDWKITSPRFWGCTAEFSRDCGFESL